MILATLNFELQSRSLDSCPALLIYLSQLFLKPRGVIVAFEESIVTRRFQRPLMVQLDLLVTDLLIEVRFWA